jgi:hypothetical protein
VKIGGDVIARDRSFLKRNQKLSDFGQGSAVGIDHYARALDGAGIHFAGLGAESSDQVEVGSGTQVVTVEERSGVRGTSAEHVGLGGAGACIDGGNRDPGQFRGNTLDKLDGAGGGPSADEHPLKIAHQGKHREMSAGKAPSAKDAESCSIWTRQKFRGDGGGGSGTQVGKIVGSDGEARSSGFRIEQQIGGLDAAFGESGGGIRIRSVSLGVIPHQHQLHSESAGGGVVTGHGEEDAVGKLRVGARGKADGGITIAKSGFEGSTQLKGVEAAADIGFGEMGCGHSFDFVADLFYRKAKWSRERTAGCEEQMSGAGRPCPRRQDTISSSSSLLYF